MLGIRISVSKCPAFPADQLNALPAAEPCPHLTVYWAMERPVSPLSIIFIVHQHHTVHCHAPFSLCSPLQRLPSTLYNCSFAANVEQQHRK